MLEEKLIDVREREKNDEISAYREGGRGRERAAPLPTAERAGEGRRAAGHQLHRERVSHRAR